MKIKEKIFNFCVNIINTKNKVNILNIDFKKPWWNVLLQQKIYLSIVFIIILLNEVFRTIFPLFIGIIIENSDMRLFGILLVIWLMTVILEFFKKYYAGLIYSRCTQSIHYNAHIFFLLVDPIYHTHRVGGTMIGKINRTAHAYEDFIDSVEDIIPTVISVITAIISLLFFDATLAALSAFMIILFAVLSTTTITYITTALERKANKMDDQLKGISVENLTQVNLIRSVFASCQVAQRLEESHLNMMSAETLLWSVYALIKSLFFLFYILMVAIIGFYILTGTVSGSITKITGASLFLTFLRGTGDIIKLSNPIRYLMRAYTRIVDFFDFIRSYGKQTYPVIGDCKTDFGLINSIKSSDNIKITIDNIFFDYLSGARIFDGHNLNLEVNKKQENKLYGIIGPSGAGKTTFISIFGGQLKPAAGFIKINDRDIYDMDDNIRKYLVAMQGQVATSMRGTLKYNLLFGTPKDGSTYTDDLLISLLESVGLWHLFKDKDRLDTFIGEGGFNLSVGQRQRLNFASLYLRAKFYKPLLLLIDEPTSSLDEASEKAITRMISELARESVTFVIAHRIKTLSEAIGILDFSLLKEEKNMQFCAPNQLLKRSDYYRKLIHGDVSIDE